MEKASFCSKDFQSRNGVIINQPWLIWDWELGLDILLAKMVEATFLDMLKILGMIQSKLTKSEFTGQMLGQESPSYRC